MNVKVFERIGIDKIHISNLHIIKNVNIEKLEVALIQAKEKCREKNTSFKSHINKRGNTILDIVLCNDDCFSRFEFHSYLFSCNEYLKPTCRIELSPGDGNNLGNLNNMTVPEMHQRLRNAIDRLSSFYGLDVDYKHALISYIEINSNIVLPEEYRTYEPILEYLIYNTTCFGKKNHLIGPSDYTSVRHETFMRCQKTKHVIMYNKSAEMRRSDEIYIDKDVLRIELVLKDNSVIENRLLDRSIHQLTDQRIVEAYNYLLIDQYLKLFDNYPILVEKLSKRILDEARLQRYTIQNIAKLINCDTEKANYQRILTNTGFINEFRKRSMYKKNVPKYIERLNKALEQDGLSGTIHMQSHMDFLFGKLQDISQYVLSEASVEVLACNAHSGTHEKSAAKGA